MSSYTAMYLGASREALGISQGYTYLAQMLSHDIVQATEVECQSMAVSGKLELLSLYGPGDASQAYFVNGKFRPPQDRWDVPRDAAGKALIPEGRNDENVIIAQLHSLFMRLHDHVFDHHTSRIDSDADRWAAAKRQVVLCFQLLVIEDLLRELLDQRVFDRYFGGADFLLPPHDDMEKWFNSGVFRFGHSMIRSSYKLKRDEVTRIGLENILRRGKSDRRIPQELRIDWDQFFPASTAHRVISANKVDAAVVKPMQHIPGCRQPEPTVDIVDRNIAASQPYTAHDLLNFVRQQAPQVYADLDLGATVPLSPTLRLKPLPSRDPKQLPLWVFVLCEAEHLPYTGNREPMLGPLGSLVVAEVVSRSIRRASASVFNNGHYNLANVKHSLGPMGNKLSVPVTGEVRMSALLAAVAELS